MQVRVLPGTPYDVPMRHLFAVQASPGVGPVVEPCMDTPATGTGSSTHGLTIAAVAKQLGLPRECPECSTGVISSIAWHRIIPAELTFTCGHSTLPVRWGKPGRHRRKK